MYLLCSTSKNKSYDRLIFLSRLNMIRFRYCSELSMCLPLLVKAKPEIIVTGYTRAVNAHINWYLRDNAVSSKRHIVDVQTFSSPAPPPVKGRWVHSTVKYNYEILPLKLSLFATLPLDLLWYGWVILHHNQACATF